MSVCRSCGAAIVWAETPDGRRQPFDRKPNPDGNRYLLGRGPTDPPVAVPIRDVDVGGYELAECYYMPHHATCPQAEQWKAAA